MSEESTDPSDRTRADEEMPAWLPRAIRVSIFWILATGIALILLIQLEDLLRYLLLALFLAFALEPAVQWLHIKHGWKRGTATGTILSAGVLLGTLAVILLIPKVVEQVGQLVERVPEWVDEINDWSQDQFGSDLVSESVSTSAVDVGDQIRSFLEDYADDVLGVVSGAIGAVFAIFTILLFAFYLTANGPQVRRVVASVLKPESQRRVLWAWETAVEKTGGYLYSKLILAIINGSAIFVVMTIVDVPSALSLAVFTGVVAAFIPVVGTYIAGALPVTVALVAVGPGAALAVLAEVLVYQQVENYWLSPRISQKTFDLNAGLAYGVAVAGGAIGGIIVAFFALPAAAVIQSFLANYARRYEVVESELTRLEDSRRA